MSTDHFLYPGMTLAAGADGMVPVQAQAEPDACCRPELCLTEVSAMCNAVDMLPTGPMWDAQKESVRRQVKDAGGVPAAGFECASMVTYAAYLGRTLYASVTNILVPALVEASPHTAVDTVDDWLERFAWVDCFRSTCRSEWLAQFSPYESDPDGCGSQYFPTAFPTDFEDALKHAILVSLRRSQMESIKTLDFVNWVIAPLGAVLTARYNADVLAALASGCDCDHGDAECDKCLCEDVQYEISSTGATLPGAPTVASFCKPTSEDTVPPVNSRQPYTDADGNVSNVFPGVVAAECIVRSMLPRPCPNIIHRV